MNYHSRIESQTTGNLTVPAIGSAVCEERLERLSKIAHGELEVPASSDLSTAVCRHWDAFADFERAASAGWDEEDATPEQRQFWVVSQFEI